MNSTKFLGWFGCFIALFHFCRTDGIYRSESACIRLFCVVKSIPKGSTGVFDSGPRLGRAAGLVGKR